MDHAANLIIPRPKPLKGVGKQRAILHLERKKKIILFLENHCFGLKPLWLRWGWAVIWGQNVCAICRGVRSPWSRGFTPSTFPPSSPFAAAGLFARLGLFFFFCHLLANAEMSGLGPVPFADPLPAVRRRRGGKGPASTGGGDISFGRRAASPCARASLRVSGKHMSPGGTLFPSPSYKSRLFPSKARNCMNGCADGKRHPWASSAAAAPRTGMLRVSTNISWLMVPYVRAGLRQYRCSMASLGS